MSLRSLVARFALCLLALTSSACDQKSEDAGHPIARADQNASNILPVMHAVPSFSFTNEDGKAFGTKELMGTPYLVAFMFTRCPSICPELTRRMKEVDLGVKKANKKLQLVSISVDPDNDTPEVLTAYAKKLGADVENWAFLTGDYKAVAKTSEDGFKMALAGQIEEGKPHLGITHGSHLILVDQTGKIRGYFRSSEDESVQAIVRALDRL